MNPFMQLVGLRDGQGASPSVMYLYPEQQQRCVCCGFITPNLWIFGLGIILCRMCYEFALNVNFPIKIEPVESYLLKAA